MFLIAKNRFYKRAFACLRRLNHTWTQPVGYDTGIQVYNCVAKKTVPLIVRDKNAVSWYTCGPTVYDSAHIGHASCYVKLDIVQRILKRHFGLNIITVMNITDVDDKIIKRANEVKKPFNVVAKQYEKEFWGDLIDLGVHKPDRVVLVSEHMPVIQSFIEGLVEKGLAYVGKDGSVYFDVEAYGGCYGKLQNLGDPGENPGPKKSAADFALWKVSKPGEPFWESKFGSGRPGWHIECSAIAGTILGSTIDFHAGGIDLRFPHHENEEAQSCGYFNSQQWINYWLHTGHLHLKDSAKMSKSLKNTISIQEMLKTWPADVFRMTCFMSNYKTEMEYSDELLKTAENNLKNVKKFINECNLHIEGKLNTKLNTDIVLKQLSETVVGVHSSYCNEFDTAGALKHVTSLITTINKMLHSSADDSVGEMGVSSLIAVSNYLNDMFDCVGFNFNATASASKADSDLENIMDVLVNFRQNIRQIGINSKDKELLSLCDEVRDSVTAAGFALNDRQKISTWSKV